MPTNTTTSFDEKYLEIILKRVRVSKTYKPKFGQGQSSGIRLKDFQDLYGSDPFYSWFGLDTPLMYAAHRAAGGITSVYRQIGIGCEALFSQILQDHLGLSEVQAKWSYETTSQGDRKRKLSLDGRIKLEDIGIKAKRDTVSRWLNDVAAYIQVAPEVTKILKGAVFEVRQGYKSKDSKRQNADLANAAAAYSQGYLPVVVVLSTQIDSDIAERYENAKLLILRGILSDSPIHSTYAFLNNVIGYDLAGFFQRNTTTLKVAVGDVLETLLSTNDEKKN
jgi:hypothetical protein